MVPMWIIKRRSKPKKPESVQPADGEILCLVCGDIANGTHFGIKTCEGCKKFFRRGLVESKSYVCTKKQACTINPRNRNNCRLCRYRKCVSSGMSREAIKMGRPRKNRKQGTAIKKWSSRRQTKTPSDDNETCRKETKEHEIVSNNDLHSSEVDFQNESVDSPITLRSLLLSSSHFSIKKGNNHEKKVAEAHASLAMSSDTAEANVSGGDTTCYKNIGLLANENDAIRSQLDEYTWRMTTQECEDSTLISAAVSTIQSSPLQETPPVSQMPHTPLPMIKIHTSTPLFSPAVSPDLASPSGSSSLSTGSSSLSLGPGSLSPGSRPISPNSRSLSPGSLSLGSLSLSSRSSSVSHGSRSLSPGSRSLSTSAQSSGSSSPLPLALSPESDPVVPESTLTTTEIEHMLALLSSNDVTEHGYMHELQTAEWTDGASVNNYAMVTHNSRNVQAETTNENPVLVRKNSNTHLLQMALNIIQSSKENCNAPRFKEYPDMNNNTNFLTMSNLDEVGDSRKMNSLSNHLSNEIMFSFRSQQNDELNKSDVMQCVQVKPENDRVIFANQHLFSEQEPHFHVCNNHTSSQAKVEDNTILPQDEGSICFNMTNPCSFENIISAIESFENCNYTANENTYIPNGYPTKDVPDVQCEEKSWNVFQTQTPYQIDLGQDNVPPSQTQCEKEQANILELIHDAAESYAMDIT